MSTENILVDIGEDYVAAITLNRPKELNTFNTHLARELVSALEELDQDARARVIILKGGCLHRTTRATGGSQHES